MRWQLLVLNQFNRIEEELGGVLKDLTVEELNRQPAPGCNSIGWCAWHLTRSHDRNMSELIGEEQIWTSDEWHAKFGREHDATETGVGHTDAQAKDFFCPSTEVIMAYHRAILDRIKDYIENRLTESDLDREVMSPTLKNTRPVMGRINGVIMQGFMHVGQAAYVRGMLKGNGWYH
jgi:hypothetical protein